MNQKLFEDFCKFSKVQLRILDFDPMYFVLKWVLEKRGYSEEQKILFLLCYVTTYRIDSADKLFSQIENVSDAFLINMKTGLERRGFRGNLNSKRHIVAFMSKRPLTNWLAGLEGTEGWDISLKRYLTLPYSGSWSSYKFADLLKHVLKYNITAPDFGTGGNGKNAGPIPGLTKILEKGWEECASDFLLQKNFYEKCLRAGVPFDGMEQCETCLCDFNSMLKGRYYPGHDIDEMMNSLAGAPEEFWEARRHVFHEEQLGELKGWTGVRKELQGLYAEKGEVCDS